MQYLAAITQARPLTVNFSLYNPPDSDGPLYVPRLLTPLGSFVRLQVTDAREQVVYETERSKIKLKLDPSKAESYYSLEPGYTYGAVFELDKEELALPAGEYQLQLTYSNLQFQGFEGHPIGELRHETTLPFRSE